MDQKPAPWRDRWWNGVSLVWFAATSAAKDVCGPRAVAFIAAVLLLLLILAGAKLHHQDK